MRAEARIDEHTVLTDDSESRPEGQRTFKQRRGVNAYLELEGGAGSGNDKIDELPKHLFQERVVVLV